ncbi:hypothetical protein M422DRAFT_118962, partial [Sphaerobolus stellatus SS14]
VQEMVGKCPSDNWITKFLSDHPEIRGSKAKGLDPKRAATFNKEAVFDYFDKLKAIIAAHQIPPENIYNMDEKGIQLGGGRKNSSTLYFFNREDKSRYILKSDSLVLITVIEAVCENGTLVPPGFILPQGSVVNWWDWDGFRVTETENGWTNDAICHQWFNKVFLPLAKSRGDPTKRILLILDGHSSHETTEMLDYAYQQEVILMELPSHTTHRLQPLDVGIFGPLQHSSIKHCEEMGVMHKEITRETVISEYMKIRAKSITSASIKDAFKKSGLWPINRHIFTDKDFAPSLQFINSHSKPMAPASYPEHHPSSLLTAKYTAGNTEDSDWVPSETDNDGRSLPRGTVTMEVDPSTVSKEQSVSVFHEDQDTPELAASSSDTRTYWTHSFNSRNKHLHREAAEAGKVAAEAHCSIQTSRALDLQEQLNEAKKPRHRGPKNTMTRILTAREARSDHEQRCAEKAAKDHEALTKQREKAAEARAREIEQARKATTQIYTVPFHCYKLKEELKDLAYALGLEISGENNELKQRIQAHMNSHPELQQEKRFAGLFAKR